MVTLRLARRASLIGALLLLAPLAMATAAAFDTDGDGVQDPQDDCPVAAGNSTVDRTGCPDRDGDGTSDKNDPWTIQSGGFLQDAHQSLSSDYYASLFNHNGSQYLTSDDGDYMRIWDTVTRQNLRSVQLSGFGDISWSPDGAFVAATTSGDELKTYYSSNMTPLFSVSTGGEDTHELEYSSDGSMIAVVGARDGGSGNGQVEIFDSMNGSLIHSFEPAGEDQFYSVDWSPDSSRILIGGDEDVWIYNVGGSWTANNSFNTNRGTNNAVAWSPDGNSFATCEAYENSGARVRMYDIASSQQTWVYSTSTSCNDLAWSPDSTQVAAAMTYYQSDGASVRIFDANSGNIVDTASGPRPGGCTGFGGSNNCGSIYGIDWHPNGLYIIGAMGRNDEGLFHWIVEPDIDGDGVLNEDDAFPEDGTQWNDTDNDGSGDNLGGTNGDACPDVAGTSTMDRYGCPDSDGDGWSDDGDDFDNDIYQWADADGDGYPANTNDTRDPSPYGELDYFDDNPTQWADTDLDGYGDNFANSSWVGIRPAEWPGQLLAMTPPQLDDIDTFPLDPEQWNDTDGDWYGDEPYTDRSDGCPLVAGRSIWDRLGCPDTDSDGWSDADLEKPASPAGDADAFIDNPSQWSDQDGDGYGDNASGFEADKCVAAPGNSMWKIIWNEETEVYDTIPWLGCEDNDGDGYANNGEAFPNDATQWSDRDGDRCGDNLTGNDADLFPDDGTQCTDGDGDGYGDSPIGPNGDWFAADPTQWKDSDGDGYGDNYANASWTENRNATWPGIYFEYASNPDVCPLIWGDVTTPEARGCPDSDNDGIPDPVDEYPADAFNQTDRDGDGYADQIGQWMDDCPDDWGDSSMGGVYGCEDSDRDGWADSIDAFPNDLKQWLDSDGDNYGDNYSYDMGIMEINGSNGTYVDVRNQSGDAFPDDETQWSDLDGDGFGENPEGLSPDAFPMRESQWKDSDGDGYGDNTTRDAFEPDECKSSHGLSWRDRLGCPDQDGDGTSDQNDPCPQDPDVWEIGIDCAAAPAGENTEGVSRRDIAIYAATGIGVIIILLLSMIMMAMFSRQLSRRRLAHEKRDFDAQEEAFQEEEGRREAWAEHYAQEGDFVKARELGWVEKAQWQVHQEQEEVEELASLPSMTIFD
jgi:hypothetical protein